MKIKVLFKNSLVADNTATPDINVKTVMLSSAKLWLSVKHVITAFGRYVVRTGIATFRRIMAAPRYSNEAQHSLVHRRQYKTFCATV